MLKHRRWIGILSTVFLVICTSGCGTTRIPLPNEQRNVPISQNEGEAKMIIQIMRFESEIPEVDVIVTARERIEEFRALPGLLQKYYV